MKLIHSIGWACFALALLFNVYQRTSLRGTAFNIMRLEFASSGEVQQLLGQWAQAPTARGTTLLEEARVNTYWDFVFIVGYVFVIIALSYTQMQREPRAWLNGLLRLNFLLAVVAGLLDVGENLVLLHDMGLSGDGAGYWSARWWAMVKFGLCGWAVVVWVGSVVSSRWAWRVSAHI